MATPTTEKRALRKPAQKAEPEQERSDDSSLKRAVIYIRVSSEEQARKDFDQEGFSLPAQREACWRQAKELGADVVDEYVDRQTGRNDRRPSLQLLLARIREQADVDYVIVHKLDRLARNRRDDANLTMQIYQHGAKLVSVSERIDETPTGQLVHGIMATINEWYSNNLGVEAIKGMTSKAKKGGTPGRAPIGYLNVGRKSGDDGHEFRTVDIDPERAPHVQWAFRTFAHGGLSTTELTEALEARGLRTVPIGKKPEVVMHKSRVANMLRNRYYIGTVTFRGIEYQGRHEPLIDPETFATVQTIGSSLDRVGESP